MLHGRDDLIPALVRKVAPSVVAGGIALFVLALIEAL